MVAGCGVGGNAGGSGSGGAGFFGITFTPEECYRLLLSQQFAQLGMTTTACEVLLSTRTAKRVFAGRELPTCVTRAPDVIVTPEPPKPEVSCATVDEKIDRAFRKCQEK